MKKYDTILFDLDGTLSDPAEGITNSVIYALKKYDIHVKDRTDILKFIGPSLYESFEKYYGFSKEESVKVVECYREYFSTKGMYENMLFEGIPELLKSLFEKGKTLAVATSKPEFFAIKILEHFKISEYFQCIVGCNLDGTRIKKDEVIAHVLHQLKTYNAETTVMIGDRKFDIEGAKHHSLGSIGVLFGYGSKEELETAGADYIVSSVAELGKHLI